MHKIIFCSRKKIYMCLPYLKFSDSLPETDFYFFYLALGVPFDVLPFWYCWILPYIVLKELCIIILELLPLFKKEYHTYKQANGLGTVFHNTISCFFASMYSFV